MKKHATLLISLMFSSCLYAVPNVWSVTSWQGFDEYYISDENNNSFIISCNTGYSPDVDHSVSIQSIESGKRVSGNLSFLIDDEAYYIPESKRTRSGETEWNRFVKAIGSATKFKLYSDNKLIGEYYPSKKNVEKIFGKEFKCTTDDYPKE